MNAETKPRSARRIAEEARGDEQESPADPTRCTAYGCPLRGSVDIGNTGRYQCHCHAHATIDRWPAITQAIRQHDWMLRIIRDVKAAGSRDTQWRKVAMLAWAIEPEMVPHEQETQALYVMRLLQDFEYRVGARERKPGPAIPQHIAPPLGEDAADRPVRYTRREERSEPKAIGSVL